ncbi:MAG: ABC transporter ATP-binding protein [Candidatus Heimdallarchaeota archaeon]
MNPKKKITKIIKYKVVVKEKLLITLDQEKVITVKDLKKEFNGVDILNGISFVVALEEIYCILGPDGSGKTTLLEILVGLRKPSSGEVTILQNDISKSYEMREIKKRIGYLPQEFRTYDNLTVKENLQFWGKMYDQMLPVSEIIELFNLTDYANKRYRQLTFPIKRKVGLATAFINDPDIVFLDEPTSGLDQFAKKEIWGILKEFKARGKTIVLTTNQALEPAIVADQVAIIHKGLLKDIGTPLELIDRYSAGSRIIIRFISLTEREKAIKALQDECPFEIIDDNIVISSEEITLAEVLNKLEKVNARYSDIITQKPTLNDAFITLTGEKLSETI